MRHDKLSASMAALVEEFDHQGTAAMLGVARAVPLDATDGDEPPSLFAYVRVEPGAVLPDLPGVRMLTQTGASRTARLSLDGVNALSEHPDVQLITPSATLRPLNDLAGQRTSLPAFKQNSGLTGQGVIVGVVDTGIDAGHPAFAGRIHSIWDQTITGNGWGTTTYGTVLTGATLGVSVDTNGHGTHVAGTAAGSDQVFGGVAPAARLVIVKTNFQNVGIGDGIRYVFHVADQLNVPAVVNLSLGGHFDPHDGSDDLSVLINGRSGQGRIVVAAAGNEGGDDIHGAVDVPPGQTRTLQFTVPPNSQPGAPPWVILNGWYPATGRCEIAVVTSSGNATPFQPIMQSGPTSTTHAFPNVTVRVTTPPAAASPNGDHAVLVEVTRGAFATAVQGGTWQLQVRNTGATAARFDVWSIVPANARDVVFQAPFTSADMKIGSPGAASDAVTVAAFTTRNQWMDASGAARAVGLPLDTISDFSSPGPLRNGARKPDVTAPGAMIVSCLSSSSSPSASNIVKAGFRVNAGTSMASPFIAGLVALMLQRNPGLDPAGVKGLLRGHSTVPGAAPGTFDPKWGFGLIDTGGL